VRAHGHTYFPTRSTYSAAVRLSVTILQPLVTLTKRAHRSRSPRLLQEEHGCLERGACSLWVTPSGVSLLLGEHFTTCTVSRETATSSDTRIRGAEAVRLAPARAALRIRGLRRIPEGGLRDHRKVARAYRAQRQCV